MLHKAMTGAFEHGMGASVTHHFAKKALKDERTDGGQMGGVFSYACAVVEKCSGGDAGLVSCATQNMRDHARCRRFAVCPCDADDGEFPRGKTEECRCYKGLASVIGEAKGISLADACFHSTDHALRIARASAISL